MRARLPVLLILVCLAVTLAAQERGVIIIKVTDDSGAVLPGATVEITAGIDQRSCITSENGQCTLLGLTPGQYEIQTSLTGFRTAVRRVTVALGQTLRITEKLSIGSLTESVTVTGEWPVIDVSTSMAVARPMRESYVYDHPNRRRRPNTEKYADPGENPFLTVSSDPLSTFSVDVDTAAYANMRRFLNDGSAPPPEAVRIEEMINYFKYSYPQPKGPQPFSITTELAECPWNNQHRLALIGLQGKNIDSTEVPPRNLVFLIDVSGSMEDDDKLPLVRHGLRMLTATLRANDRVAIVVYAGNSGLVLPSTTGDKKEVIDAAIAGLDAGGSTNGGEGIKLAYRIARQNFINDGVNRVILATDGDFNVGIVDQGELEKLIERERESRVFLSVLGVGEGNLQDATMEMLADKGNGNYSYLDSAHEAQRVLIKEASSTFVTIAKDVKIQVEFNPANVGAYRLIGYENRMLKKEDFNDDRKDAGEIGAGHSVTAIYEIVPAGVALDGPLVDPLKYAAPAPAKPGSASAAKKYDDELLTVKLRYKAPDGGASKLTSTVVVNRLQPIGANLGFASAVAEAGMVLRETSQAKNASFSSAIARAKQFRGDDAEGYRAEFIRLMELAAALPNNR